MLRGNTNTNNSTTTYHYDQQPPPVMYHRCAVTASGYYANDQEEARPATGAGWCGQCGTSNNNNNWDALSVVKYLLNTLFVILCGLMLYALAITAGEPVRSTCPLLWEFFAVRCTVGILMLAFLTIVSYRYGQVPTHIDHVQEGQEEAPVAGNVTYDVMLYTTGGFAIMYLVIFAVLETIVLVNIVVNKQQCVDALRVSTLGNRPLLSDLGWVYTTLDYVCAIFVAYAFVKPNVGGGCCCWGSRQY